MRIEFGDASMCIIPEDFRDELYLDQVLNIKSKKIFVRVKKCYGQHSDFLGIELKEFNPDIKRDYVAAQDESPGNQ